MATVKINYGGTVYSMVKTSSKITTPSIKVDGGYIPCFKGDRFAEVLNGSMYYTLSPIKVGEYRMACGSRAGFNGNVNLILNFDIISEGEYVGSSLLKYTCSVYYKSYSVSVTQAGFTASISNFNISPTSASDSDYGSTSGLSATLNATCSGNVTVKDGSGNTVKSFSFSKGIRCSGSHSGSSSTGSTTRSTSQTYQIG